MLNTVAPRSAEPGNWFERRRACSGALFRAVDRPAGAASPSLVTAVAVVRFFATVLFTMLTKAESSSAMPPPSWAETLFAIVLSEIVIVPGFVREMCDPLVCSSRMPPPSSLARLVWMMFASIVTGPEPSDRFAGSAGSSPAIMMPPPSS